MSTLRLGQGKYCPDTRVNRPLRKKTNDRADVAVDLGALGFDALIDEALLRFDRVVVDSAPVHAVSDTLLMLHRMQSVLLVVRSGKTPRKAAARAVELLYKASAPLAGVILNRQARRRLTGGYDPYYSYSYESKYSEKGVYGA